MNRLTLMDARRSDRHAPSDSTHSTWPGRLARRLLGAMCLSVFALNASAQSGAREEFVVIHAKRVITVSGEEIENGTIVIVDGKIRHVGRQIEYPGDAEVIDASDQVVMPGFIHVNTRANLPNYSRNGNNSHRNVTDDVRLDELRFDDYLENGFTAVCLHPPGGGIPGMSAVYRTAGDDPDERRLRAEPYLLIHFRNPGSDKGVVRAALRKAEQEIAKVEKARQEWEEKQKQEAEARSQSEQQKPEGGQQTPPAPPPAPQQRPGGGRGSPPSADEPPAEGQQAQAPTEFKPPAIEADVRRIVAMIRKEAKYPMALSVSGASDFLHARDVLSSYEQFRQQYFLQDGFRGGDFNHIVEALGGAALRVAIAPTMRSLPETSTQYNLVADLVHYGCEVSFMPTSDNAGGLRQMQTLAADLVRNGLPRADAIRAMTIHPARFVGVDDRVGTIEKDKEADLIFLDADPVDPAARVKRVMVGGRIVWEHES